MAKREKLVIAGNAKASAKTAANSARESTAMRALRIDGSSNGATLRTRVIKNKKLYNRNFKHKKSFANAEDFAFLYGKTWSGRGEEMFKNFFEIRSCLCVI